MTWRIGVLGGTFDPVHYGHLMVAESCREQLLLDQVRFIPAAKPPHKLDETLTDGNIRADMLTLAVSGYPEFVIDRRELKRTGPSFTIDTLTDLAAENPGRELFLLMGADSLRDLLTWRNPQGITDLAVVVACSRPGIPALHRSQVVEWVGKEIAERVKTVTIPGTDLSSTNLRRRVAERRSLRFMTPRAVETFIAQHQLYAAQASTG